MKLLIFTEGTILMHENAKGCAREEIVQQARDKEESIYDYASYIPVNNAIDKVKEWQSQGHQINYLTSRILLASDLNSKIQEKKKMKLMILKTFWKNMDFQKESSIIEKRTKNILMW